MDERSKKMSWTNIFMVPLIMILAAVGTAIIVGLLMGLIRLIFGQKAIDFIKSIPQRLDSTANVKRS